MVKVTALTREDVDTCPVRSILVRVTGKWHVLILLTLMDAPHRFGALKRAVGDITQRVLTENLRTLERDGYLTRTVLTGSPVAVSYELTALGREAAVHLQTLVNWASTVAEDVRSNRQTYDTAAAGP